MFSEDNKTFYVSCMGTQNVMVGDAVADKPLRTIALDKPYPHGIVIQEKIDRLLATSTVRATDLGDAGGAISVVELSTGKSLGSIKVSNKASPARDAPVEILFAPELQSAGRLCHQHVWRHALVTQVECADEGF